MKRREFLKKAAPAAATAGLVGCGGKEEDAGQIAALQKELEACKQKAATVVTKKTYEWKMVTTWPPNLPVLQTGAERFAKRVEEDPLARKVHESFKKFKAQVGVWGSVSENAYYNVIADKYALKM